MVASVLLLLLVPCARGEEPLVGDRPDFTESAVTVPSGSVQLEAGLTRTDADETDVLELGEILVRIGLGQRVELRLGAGSFVDVDSPAGDFDGLSDASVGVKLRLDDPASRDAMRWGLIIDTTLPTGDSEIGAEDPQPGAKFLVARTLSDRLELAANANYRHADDEGEGFDRFSGSVSLAIGVGGPWGVYAELFGFTEETQDGPSTTYANAGVTYSLGPELQLDARLGTGLGGTDVDLFIGAGVVKRW